MILYQIAAFSENFALGKDNKLLWHHSEDLKFFKQQTLSKIIFVGRLVNGKNFEKWMSVATFLLKNGITATFEIYGTGPYEQELKKQIQASGFGDRIKLKGYKKEIEEVYKSADLLLFLSGYESFGNVVVESILCGTPVITFDIPSMKEIFKEYPEFLVENNEQYQKDIYDKVNKISFLKNVAVKASSDFSQRFGSISHISKLEAIYNELS